MGQTSGAPKFDPLKSWRELRDAGMDSWAKIVLDITSSPTYSQVSSVVAKPTLVMAGIVRKEVEKAMTIVLAQANMPSRKEVLALSTRLTHIEMALDDLAAAVEALGAQQRRPPATVKRIASGDRAPTPLPKEG
jgi:hypothetical protein